MPSRAKVPADEVGFRRPMPDLATFLRELDDGEHPPPDWSTDAGIAFRYIYDAFVRRGGYDRGKPRHAARQIKTWLGKNQVRSLETKLAGKTWLQYPDAFSLLKIFLEHWSYNKANDSYTPYAQSDLGELARHLLGDLFPNETKAILLPERSRTSVNGGKVSAASGLKAPSTLQLTRPSGEVIKGLFAQSDALVTVSREKTIIGSEPAEAMTGFHDLMASLHKIDLNDQRQRIAIWVIDIGLRNDKKAARGALYNVHFLVAQFRAIALIERASRERLQQWLHEHVCIIVGSLQVSEIDQIYNTAEISLTKADKDLPWFQSDRLFVESVPTRWLDVSGSDAFGQSQGMLWHMPTVTAHLRLDDWDDVDHPKELDVRHNLRYLLHGDVKELSDDQNVDSVRCIDLPEPGSRWSDAYRLAIQAALRRLNRPWDKRLGDVKPEEALAQLRGQHFAALTLNEFLRLPDALTKAAQADVNVL